MTDTTSGFNKYAPGAHKVLFKKNSSNSTEKTPITEQASELATMLGLDFITINVVNLHQIVEVFHTRLLALEGLKGHDHEQMLLLSNRLSSALNAIPVLAQIGNASRDGGKPMALKPTQLLALKSVSWKTLIQDVKVWSQIMWDAINTASHVPDSTKDLMLASALEFLLYPDKAAPDDLDRLARHAVEGYKGLHAAWVSQRESHDSTQQ